MTAVAITMEREKERDPIRQSSQLVLIPTVKIDEWWMVVVPPPLSLSYFAPFFYFFDEYLFRLLCCSVFLSFLFSPNFSLHSPIPLPLLIQLDSTRLNSFFIHHLCSHSFIHTHSHTISPSLVAQNCQPPSLTFASYFAYTTFYSHTHTIEPCLDTTFLSSLPTPAPITPTHTLHNQYPHPHP